MNKRKLRQDYRNRLRPLLPAMILVIFFFVVYVVVSTIEVNSIIQSFK